MGKLDGKVAVVTGGAMGNGLGVVKVFLKHGASVVVFDYSDQLSAALTTLKQEYPTSNIIGYKADIRDSKMIDACFSDLIGKMGHVDILVNNAGVCELVPFDTMTDEVRDKQFDINIKGTWNVTRSALPHLKKAKDAAIVNLSSVTGVMVADPGEVAYATTKAALMGFTKGLAAELVKDKIRVNAILPGYIRTPMVEAMAKLSNPKDPESVINGIIAGIPMGRMGTPEELGELAAFLASTESSYITGQGIVFDGASTLPETTTMGV